MKKRKLNPVHIVLDNKYLRKIVILTPLLIMTILTMIMVSINHGIINMELTNFMTGLFLGCVVWFFLWIYIIIINKNKISRYVLSQQKNRSSKLIFVKNFDKNLQ